MNISVIVCTYNNSESLKDTLDSLLVQDRDENFDYEIIIVDNNSSDDTKQTVESYFPKFDGRLKYVFEPNQGLSRARNRGVKESKGEIVAFTDNDCIVDREWLQHITNKFSKDMLLTGILGNATWEDGSPVYTTLKILRGNGLNMCFRKQIFKDVGGFDPFLGAGSVGDSAEDVEFIYRISRLGKKVEIVNDIQVIHKMRKGEKQNLRFVYRDSKGYIIFWLKYFLRHNDIFAFKKIYWFVTGVFFTFLTEIKNKNSLGVKVMFYKNLGGIVGLIKGPYIWLFYAPVKSRNLKRNST